MNEGIHDVIGCDPLQGQGVREEGDLAYPSHVKLVMSFHFTLERVGETEKRTARIDGVPAAAASFSTSYKPVVETVSRRRKGVISLIFTALLIAFPMAWRKNAEWGIKTMMLNLSTRVV